MCKAVSDFQMKIISNKHTLQYNRPTIHSIQRYNDLCDLTKYLSLKQVLLLFLKLLNFSIVYVQMPQRFLKKKQDSHEVLFALNKFIQASVIFIKEFISYCLYCPLCGGIRSFLRWFETNITYILLQSGLRLSFSHHLCCVC